MRLLPICKRSLTKREKNIETEKLCALALLKMLSHGWKPYSVANRLLIDEIPVSFKTCCIIMTNKEI